MLKPRLDCAYESLVADGWKDLPPGLGDGRWKLLNVSPEQGSWTAAFFYPAGVVVPSHIHTGPGEYFMIRGKLEVRGGDGGGGDTATAPGYGYEATGAVHDETIFLEDTEVYMRFQGPLQFVDKEGRTVFMFGWEQAQQMWNAA